MGQRFSDIRRSAKLARQLAGYIDYLSNPRTLTKPYQARGARTNASIVPFGGGFPTGTTVAVTFETKTLNDALATAVTATTGSAITVPRAANAQSMIGFRPARVTRVMATTKTVTETPSKYTNVAYRKYNTDRASVPFGGDGTTDEYLEVIKVMKSDLVPNPAPAICWISFSPEVLRFR